MNSTVTGLKVSYWREGNYEVDFVISLGQRIAAIEVKSGVKLRSAVGLEKFKKIFTPERALIVGTGGIPIEDFLSTPVQEWFDWK